MTLNFFNSIGNMAYPSFINPIAFQLGSLPIYWYGLLYLSGLFIGIGLGRLRTDEKHIDWTQEQVDNIAFNYIIPGMLIGARLGEMLLYHFSYFIHHPESFLLDIRKGGLSFFGGLIGVVITLVVYSLRFKKDFLEVTDFIAPLAPPGLGLGRIGNFINGELWGRPSNVAWAIVFPWAGPKPRHPSQLYECLLEGILLHSILWQFSKKPRPKGAISGLFAILYGSARFFVEYFREPSLGTSFTSWHGLTLGQLLSLPLLFVGLLLLSNAYRKA